LDGTLRFAWFRSERHDALGMEPDWEGLLASDEVISTRQSPAVMTTVALETAAHRLADPVKEPFP
jgi:hypothetical protein